MVAIGQNLDGSQCAVNLKNPKEVCYGDTQKTD
jgi:hypothetical protein